VLFKQVARTSPKTVVDIPAFKQEHEEASEMTLSQFNFDLSQEENEALKAIFSNEDDPPLLISWHFLAVERFVNAVIGYAGPILPPVGFVIPPVVNAPNLIQSILNFLRRSWTANPSPAPIGTIALPCSPAEFFSVSSQATELRLSPWIAALSAVPVAGPICPLASLWTPRPGTRNFGCDPVIPRPLPALALWD
jgi:hypothetical protein